MQLRRVIITAVLAMLAVAAVAPRSRAEGYAGFRGGVNLASFSGDGTFSPYGPLLPGEMFPKNAFPPLEYSDTRKGFTGAAFVGWDKGKMGFRSEIGYTMKGAKSGDASIKLDYVEFAPLFTFRLPVSSGIAVRLIAGPMAGLFVNAEADNGSIDVDLGDIVEHVEFSGTLGAELEWKTGPYRMIFDARYTMGTPVFENEDLDGDLLEYDVKNAGIAVTAGILVPF